MGLIRKVAQWGATLVTAPFNSSGPGVCFIQARVRWSVLVVPRQSQVSQHCSAPYTFSVKIYRERSNRGEAATATPNAPARGPGDIKENHKGARKLYAMKLLSFVISSSFSATVYPVKSALLEGLLRGGGGGGSGGKHRGKRHCQGTYLPRRG